MAEADDRFSTKTKMRKIELDPMDPIILVHYDRVVVDHDELDEDGKPAEVSRESHTARVKLGSFKSSSDAEKFAKKVVEGCKYIHPSKIDRVMMLLEQLRDRIIAAEAAEAEPEVAVDNDSQEDEDSRPVPGKPRRGFQEERPVSRGGASRPDRERERERERDPRGGDRDRASPRGADDSLGRSLERGGGLKKGTSQRVSTPAETPEQARARKKAEEAEAQEREVRAAEARIKAERDRVQNEADRQRRAKVDALEAQRKSFETQLHSESSGSAGRAASMAREQAAQQQQQKKQARPEKPVEVASMNKISEYMELLYGERDEKIRGSAMLLQLVYADPAHLEYFAQDGQLLTTISRVLDEDRKNSLELTTNILEIFFTFSSFRQLHGLLMEHKVDTIALNIIDFELRRFKTWQEAPVNPDPNKAKEEALKQSTVYAKQERLLYVCFYLLLNLAEDTDKELVMVNSKNKLITHLMGMLARQRTPKKPDEQKFLCQVHLLVATLLKKLSIFRENKTEMARLNIVSAMDYFLSVDDDDVVETSLRFLFNLSFDPQLRDALVQNNMVSKCVSIFKRAPCRPACVRMLYNISMDDRYKDAAADGLTAAAPLVATLLARSQGAVDAELLALAINLAASALNAEVMTTGGQLKTLVQRIAVTQDPLMMKLIRNLSQHENVRATFKPLLHELVQLTLKSTTAEFLVEALGTLASLPFTDIPYYEFFAGRYNLGEFLMRQLSPGITEDDIILEAVMVLGVALVDPKVASILGTARHVNTLFSTMVEKGSDPEMVLQIGFVFLKLLLHEGSRGVVLEHEDLIKSLLSLVADPIPHIRDVANMCLDVIMDFNETWRNRIRDTRFETLNREWIERALHNVRPSMQISASASRSRSYPASASSVDSMERGEHKDYSDMYRSGSPSPVTSPGGDHEDDDNFQGSSVRWNDNPTAFN